MRNIKGPQHILANKSCTRFLSLANSKAKFILKTYPAKFLYEKDELVNAAWVSGEWLNYINLSDINLKVIIKFSMLKYINRTIKKIKPFYYNIYDYELITENKKLMDIRDELIYLFKKAKLSYIDIQILKRYFWYGETQLE